MFYRPYQPGDFGPLYALEERCFEPEDRFSRRYIHSLLQRPKAATWIAEENGRLMGFAIVDWRRRKNEIAAYIQTIEVDAEARRRGVGRELLSRMEASAQAAGAALIRLHVEAANAAAVKLYEARGYRCQGRCEQYYSADRAGLVYCKYFYLDSAESKPLSGPR